MPGAANTRECFRKKMSQEEKEGGAAKILRCGKYANMWSNLEFLLLGSTSH